MRLLIDANYLSKFCHPRPYAPIVEWMRENLVTNRGFVPVIPAVIDYEVRRGFLLETKYNDPFKRAAFQRSIENLDELLRVWVRTEPSRDVLHSAADLWATARRHGYPNANEERVDIDVIVAAEALRDRAQVLTTNRRHFEPFGITVLDPAADNRNAEENQPPPT